MPVLLFTSHFASACIFILSLLRYDVYCAMPVASLFLVPAYLADVVSGMTFWRLGMLCALVD